VAADTTLSPRALNRALLARQGLLERRRGEALAEVERLAGLQAQVPAHPYVALWARLDGFTTDELSDALAGRAAVRAQLLRSTIHLVSARDALALHPLCLPVLARMWKSPFAAGLGIVAAADVAAAAAELLAAEPRTRAELGALLGKRFPGADTASLAYAATSHLAVVQVPPRGLWGQSGQPRWALTEKWLEAPLDAAAAIDDIVLRYLAAFGPATAADIRTWSGFTGLRAVLARLRQRLRTFRDEPGRELFDVPGAPFPDPGTPAPPRFLPEYDNVLLSHADRARIMDRPWPGPAYPTGSLVGNLLLDGFYRATWEIAGGILTIAGWERRRGDPKRDEVAAEGERLLAFAAAGGGQVRFT
jgi:hypothetical protein